MKRKHLAILLSGVLAAAMLAGCGKTPSHTHTAQPVWGWNSTEHWHPCACGVEVEVAPHNLTDDLTCADCGVELWDMGDGYVDAISYDAHGEVLRMVSFQPNGRIIGELRWERAYDADDRPLSVRFYVDDFLQDEDEYGVNADGDAYVMRNTNYQEDGSYGINEYDENSNLIMFKSYDADGTLTYES